MTHDLSRQLAAIQEEMTSRPKGLQEHTERVAKEAITLARCWDVDPLRVELASWIHDLFRHLPRDEQLRQAREVGIEPTVDDMVDPIVLHGPSAARAARYRFGISDEEVLEAVAAHTLGIPQMTQVAKILLIADKVEPAKRKKRPIMKAIRKLARRDLDLALLCWSDWSWYQARENGWVMHPDSWQARDAWVREHHIDRGGPLHAPGAAFENDG